MNINENTAMTDAMTESRTCCDCAPDRNIPLNKVPNIVELQAEGIGLTKHALEQVQKIRTLLFGIGPASCEKRNDPQNARDALVYQNAILKELVDELLSTSIDLGC